MFTKSANYAKFPYCGQIRAECLLFIINLTSTLRKNTNRSREQKRLICVLVRGVDGPPLLRPRPLLFLPRKLCLSKDLDKPKDYEK